MPPRRERGDEPEIELPSLDNYVERIRENNPGLTDADLDPVRRLAVLYRQLDYFGHLLETDPGDAYALDWYQKTATLALRHEAALGIGKDRDPGDAPAPPNPIRRK